MCLLERRTNKYDLHDTRFGLYERAITFEGPEVHSEPVPLRGTVLAKRIQNLCNEVVDQVQQVTAKSSDGKQKIVRMVANWKVDRKENIWLLYTTCIRVDMSNSAYCRSSNMSSSIGSSRYGHLAEQTAPVPSNTMFHNLYPHPHHHQNVHGTGCTTDALILDSMVKLPDTVQLQQEPIHDSSVVVSNHTVFTVCPSCHNEEPKKLFYPVPYKTIIAHFEQVIKLISYEGEDGTIVDWPPDAALIKTAGGVGFGGLSKYLKDNKFSEDKHILRKPENHEERNTADVVIPPIIRQLHRRLKTQGYQRYRQDPLFLHKACDVCEKCFLSYAQLSSTNFQIVRPICLDGNDAKERRHRTEQRRARHELDKERWEPVSDNKTDEGRHRHKQNKHKMIKGNNKMTIAKHNARVEKSVSEARKFADGPEFPAAILAPVTDSSTLTSALLCDEETSDARNEHGREHRSASVDSGATFNAKNDLSSAAIDAMVQQRERSFFKEIALQGKHAVEKHTLSHMISTQQTLRNARRDNKMLLKGKIKSKNPYEEVFELIDDAEKMKRKKMDWWEKKKVTRLPYPPLKKENETKDALFGNDDGNSTVVDKNTNCVENEEESAID